MTEVKGEWKPGESRVDVRVFFGTYGNVTEVIKGKRSQERAVLTYVFLWAQWERDRKREVLSYMLFWDLLGT